MKPFKLFPILLSFFLLTSCAQTELSPQTYLAHKGLGVQTQTAFQQCHGYGCKFIKTVSLTSGEWERLEALFQPAPETPEAERALLSRAIGLFEELVGPKTNTAHDIAGTFRKLGDTQLDCVDESTNTTVYLSVMKQRGLIHFHDIAPPMMRLPLINAGHWPHQTAVLRETKTSAPYAVDSWFRNNGAPADIVPLKQWKDGWKPKNIGESWL